MHRGAPIYNDITGRVLFSKHFLLFMSKLFWSFMVFHEVMSRMPGLSAFLIHAAAECFVM